jgi:glycosyltransferase involved in cell wall biosynthesis
MSGGDEMSTREPLFSVVVPAFNAEATVASALTSALGQTLTDLELIVVNDGSTDGTAAIVEKVHDPRVRLLSQSNRGLPAARNAGIAVARGRYIAFLDSDDLWLPRYLDLAEQALASTVRPGFAYTDAYAFDPVTGEVRCRSVSGNEQPGASEPGGHAFLLELIRRNFIFVSTIVPSAVLAAVGGFDEGANAAEDYQMWLRIAVSGYDVAWMPGNNALYRMHENQMTRDKLRILRGDLRALNAIRIEDMPTPAHRELLALRRRDTEREISILEGNGPAIVSSARRLRRRLGRLRERAGLGEQWTKSLPPDVASVFPDLTAV